MHKYWYNPCKEKMQNKKEFFNFWCSLPSNLFASLSFMFDSIHYVLIHILYKCKKYWNRLKVQFPKFIYQNKSFIMIFFLHRQHTFALKSNSSAKRKKIKRMMSKNKFCTTINHISFNFQLFILDYYYSCFFLFKFWFIFYISWMIIELFEKLWHFFFGTLILFNNKVVWH